MTPRARITLHTARPSQVATIHALIASNQAEGHLLPRTLGDVRMHAERFVVAVRSRRIVGCAELAPLGPGVAEVRSLAVDVCVRDNGVGTLLVHEVQRRARVAGYARLCAFSHTPGYFARLGFSIVPHMRVPEKVVTDCVRCPLFGHCGHDALLMTLQPIERADDGTTDVTMMQGGRA